MIENSLPLLKGAKEAGMKTAFVPRPFELGPATKIDMAPESYIDVIAADMVDLAGRLGA